jgi:D-aminopeptidase
VQSVKSPSNIVRLSASLCVSMGTALNLARILASRSAGEGDCCARPITEARSGAASSHGLRPLTMLPNDQINPVFLATVQATEEAVINALVAAETMTGVNGHTVVALPHDRLREVLQKYNRLLK